MALGEKGDVLRDEQDEVMQLHAMSLSEGSKALQEEGALLESVQTTNDEDPPLDAYIANMERLIRRRMERDRALYDRLMQFKKCLAEEEETHSKVLSMSQMHFHVHKK